MAKKSATVTAVPTGNETVLFQGRGASIVRTDRTDGRVELRLVLGPMSAESAAAWQKVLVAQAEKRQFNLSLE